MNDTALPQLCCRSTLFLFSICSISKILGISKPSLSSCSCQLNNRVFAAFTLSSTQQFLCWLGFLLYILIALYLLFTVSSNTLVLVFGLPFHVHNVHGVTANKQFFAFIPQYLMIICFSYPLLILSFPHIKE